MQNETKYRLRSRNKENRSEGEPTNGSGRNRNGEEVVDDESNEARLN